MANEYDQIIADAVAKCELLSEGQSREECCKEKGITDCPSLHSPFYSQNEGMPFVMAGSGILTLCALVYFAFRKGWLLNQCKSTKAIVVAWVIWVFITLSYVFLLEPYGYSIEGDELNNLFLWCILPPLAALAIFYWVKKFLSTAK